MFPVPDENREAMNSLRGIRVSREQALLDDDVLPRRIASPTLSGVGIFPAHLRTRLALPGHQLTEHGFGPPEEPFSVARLPSCLLVGETGSCRFLNLPHA